MSDELLNVVSSFLECEEFAHAEMAQTLGDQKQPYFVFYIMSSEAQERGAPPHCPDLVNDTYTGA